MSINHWVKDDSNITFSLTNGLWRYEMKNMDYTEIKLLFIGGDKSLSKEFAIQCFFPSMQN